MSEQMVETQSAPTRIAPAGGVAPRRTPSAWSVALVVGAGIALLETLIVAVMYRNVPGGGVRFLATYLTGSAAVAGLSAGVLAAIAAKLLKRRSLGIALGVGLAWSGILGYRGNLLSLQPSWGNTHELPLKPILGGAAAAAVLVGVVAYVVSRTRLGRIRYSLPMLIVLAVAAAALFLSRPAAPAAPAALLPPSASAADFQTPLDRARTNVLLVSIDTLRADHTTPYGYARDTTPQIQALADRGVLFEHCTAQRTSTAGSMPTLFTGMYPPTHRVFNNGNVLQDFNLTLAEMLADEGFVTAGIDSNPACGDRYGFNQGFAHFAMAAADVPKEEMEESREVTRVALEWLEANRSGRFFLWVHYKDPHAPYIVPREYRELYLHDPLSSANKHKEIPIGRGSPHGSIKPTAVVENSRDVDFYIAQYDAEIRYTDDNLAPLFEALGRWGLTENTLVILTADHGEGIGEHDYYFAHGDDCHESTAHVPLVVAHPRLRQGARVPTPVSLVDVVPTIREVLGLTEGPLMQGQSFAGALVGEGQFEARPYHFTMGSYRNGYMSHAVRNGRYKLIHDVDERWIYLDVEVEGLARRWRRGVFTLGDKYRCRVMQPELYDLMQDPLETRNLAGTGLPVEQELADRLWDWQATSYAAGESRGVAAAEMSREDIEAMRALGYVEEAKEAERKLKDAPTSQPAARKQKSADEH